jgi:predicted RecB family nuclease
MAVVEPWGADMVVTASLLYNLITCPHRVTMDLFADPAERDEVSPFVRMLWERGALHEQATITSLGAPFLDLSNYHGDEKERLTTEAIERGEPLIYGGRIRADDLLGEPDLLRRDGTGYIAGDIKSGAGLGGSEDLSTPKAHYAAQLSLYVDILERKGWSAGRVPFVWDIHGEKVPYDLDAQFGTKNPTTLWAEYQEALAQARQIVSRSAETTAACSAACKLCWWYTACLTRLEAANDLTLLPELGRSTRDAVMPQIDSIVALARADLAEYIVGKKTVFGGIGPSTLVKMQERARLVTSVNPQPYLKEPLALPYSDLEIFFDIETDPLRDVCYLHGFIERHGGDNTTERFYGFFVRDLTDIAEEEAFAAAWAYLRDRPSAIVYYYSKYERTVWRKLRHKYPGVCTEVDIEALFDPVRAVDLYFDVVRSKTEWPTRDFSIKTLAKFLGFEWRDASPSGAASIEWFDRWAKSGDPVIKERIITYNQDDCRATRVLLDGIRGLARSSQIDRKRTKR